MAMDTGGVMGASGGAAFANGPAISNYKGVMLCDRPSADIGSSKPAPFNSAVVPPTQLGLNPPKKVNVYSSQHKPKGTAAREPCRTPRRFCAKRRARRASVSRASVSRALPALTGRPSRARYATDTNSVLYKHKQYLAHLQKDIKLQKAEEAAMENESEEKRKRFVERSAQLRDAIRAGLLATGDAYAEAAEAQNAAAEQETPAPAPSPPADEEPVAPKKEQVVIPPLNLGSEKDGKELLGKPKWALTEEQAEEQDELQEEVDLDELLDFVEDLDFEEYVDDIEVRTALEIMKSRIASIDTYRSEASAREQTGEAVVLRPEGAGDDAASEREEGWDPAGADEEAKLHSDEAIAAARKVLDSSRKLRQVHSTKSMAAKLEALREEVAQEGAQEMPQRQEKDVDPSNLPYLYRNPAV